MNNLFVYINKTIEVVDTYKYLGTILQRKGHLNIAVKYIAELGVKASLSLLKRARNFKIPVDLLLSTFD